MRRKNILNSFEVKQTTIIEKNGRTAIMGANGNIGELFTRPIALVLFAVAIIMAFLPLIKMKMAAKKAANA